MSTYDYQLSNVALSTHSQNELALLGFMPCHRQATHPWLALIDLSQAVAEDVTDILKANPAKNQIAVLKPEQTDIATTAMQQGVQDYLLHPIDEAQVQSLFRRLRRLEQPDNELVVASATSRQLLMLAHRAASTEASVLLTGESGTGKEPVARYIHRHSNRADKPFIAVNCAAIPESILESILFGHVKGAFTGASCDQAGKFEMANGGTILLDEIGEMPILLQAKLLRVLQEREVERVGGHQSIALDIRVIAATNRDLRQAVKQGDFREDLFYRLDVLPLKITPLRDRREDILPLAAHFLKRYQPIQTDNCFLSEAAKQLLLAHDWPGNVRELENTIQRALIMRRGLALQAAELGIASESHHCVVAQSNSESGLKASKKQAEFQYIIDTLKRFNGHRSHSADSLGMTTRALRYKLAQMREQGIDIDKVLADKGQAA
ncbi:sigma-54-dependent Fis family transcriptional regulator [Shewanella sp. Scap07]|uniref:sigma-54 interaction domain-containing protein n=1 Tax=Shewanella sp. Scap07 TaxID=2589987 RepID=UPI0015BA1ED7|nr:sigma-54 dependent transcriptional regulator [Shewanella sp. Scap07]QLE87548.1 sigma-54-dependent Fis family transcriptional regulator [Shewanella sp. Scap07]